MVRGKREGGKEKVEDAYLRGAKMEPGDGAARLEHVDPDRVALAVPPRGLIVPHETTD
jgi:hypothetical protein